MLQLRFLFRRGASSVPAIFAISVLSSAFGADEGVAIGEQLYKRSCTTCHGETGKGGRGPDLTTGNWRFGRTDDLILKNIMQGIAGTEMPAFKMTQSEGENLVAYLHSLKTNPPDQVITGNSVSGRSLFFGSAGCSGCHQMQGKGGRLGPDLTSLGKEKNATELKESIINPDKAVARGYAQGEAQLASGQVVRGAIKLEDTFSVQLMDTSERLHMLQKQELKGFQRIRKSLMPVASISPVQVDDLLAFLKNPGPAPTELTSWTPAADLNITSQRLLNARSEPQNWLTYWGDYRGTHFSGLNSITPANAHSLTAKWSYQFAPAANETFPIVVDGVMFITGPLNDAAAVDARTGKTLWEYKRRLPAVAARCTVMTNRGFAIYGDRLYMATLDTHLVSLDAKTGAVIWDIAVEDYKKGYNMTLAPLVVDGKVIVGTTAGECGLVGLIDAYDAKTGEKLWRRYTVAQPGDPNRATWAGKSAETGGGPTWMTGTYDAETDTLFWPVGNPGPDYDGSVRAGDNLYTGSILALDLKTGNIKWYFQFTPHDTHDWDANETPVLVDAMYQGRMRKLLLHADRNGFYYVLDRVTGQFLTGKAFAKQNWAKGLDEKGRPIVIPGTDTTPEGVYICPDSTGATNFAAPSYDAKSTTFFLAVRETCAIFTSRTREPVPGTGYTGTGATVDQEIVSTGAIRALDAVTGDLKWNFPLQEGSNAAGVLATAGGVVFAASRDGNFIALDSSNGKPLWHYQTGGMMRSSPMSYAVDGKQYVAITAGNTLITFGLP